MKGNKMKKNNVRIFDVIPSNDNRGGWKVVNKKGTCLRRAHLKRDAEQAGAELARDSAFGGAHFDAMDAQLRIHDREGMLLETRNYTRQS